MLYLVDDMLDLRLIFFTLIHTVLILSQRENELEFIYFLYSLNHGEQKCAKNLPDVMKLVKFLYTLLVTLNLQKKEL